MIKNARKVSGEREEKESEEGSAKKYAKYDVTRLQDSVYASSELQGKELGRMMWEDQAIEFWQTTAGGSMSKRDAERKRLIGFHLSGFVFRLCVCE